MNLYWELFPLFHALSFSKHVYIQHPSSATAMSRHKEMEAWRLSVCYYVMGASQIAQWLRTHLLMQERRVWFLSWKDFWRRKRNLLQDSCLENSMNRGAWWASRVYGVAELNMTEWLSTFHDDPTTSHSSHTLYHHLPGGLNLLQIGLNLLLGATIRKLGHPQTTPPLSCMF